jgi:hypothetical protein
MEPTRALFLGAFACVPEIHSGARSAAEATLEALYAHAIAQNLLVGLRPLLAAVEADAGPKEQAVTEAEAAVLQARKDEALATARFWTAKADDPEASPDEMAAAGVKVGDALGRLEQARHTAREAGLARELADPDGSAKVEMKLATEAGRLRAKEIRELVRTLEAIPEPDVSVLARYLNQPRKMK